MAGKGRKRSTIGQTTPDAQRKHPSASSTVTGGSGVSDEATSSINRQLRFSDIEVSTGIATQSMPVAAAAAVAKRRKAAKAMKRLGVHDHISIVASTALLTTIMCSLTTMWLSGSSEETRASSGTPPMGLFQCNFKGDGAVDGSMVVSIVTRNSAKRLAPFFTALSAQRYPKDKICLHVTTDSNLDETEETLDRWITANRKRYGGIEYVKPFNATVIGPQSNWGSSAECDHRPHCWTVDRQNRVSRARHVAYRRALISGAKYFVSIDSDVMLGHQQTLERMVAAMPSPGVLAPQLLTFPNTWDSNVWLETTSTGYYTRGKFQLSFRSRRFTGCVRAAAVHSLFSIDLRAPGAKKIEFFNEKVATGAVKEQLTDTYFLAHSAARAGVPIYGCNTFSPGVMPSIAGHDSFDLSHQAVNERFRGLAAEYLATMNDDPEKTYSKYWPEIADETALGCGTAADCACPPNDTPQLSDQLKELRNATLKHLDRAVEEGHVAVCAWNGDCSDKHFTVDRRSNLSLTDFVEEYAMMRRPVVIADYINGHNRLSASGEPFDADFWKRTCGKEIFYVQKADKAKTWGGLSSHSSQSLNASFELLDDPNLDSSVYGIFDSPLTRSCRSFLSQFVMPKYFANDYLQKVHPNITLTYRDSWPSFFLGRGGTGGNLHVDMFGSSFWMAVFEGRKHWRFADEGQRHLLYEHRPTNDFPDVDLFNPDYERFPLLRHVRTFDVVLEPGDLLFVPGSSPHQVRNVEGSKSIALAGNYIDIGSLETAREECDHPERGAYTRYREIRTTILQPDFPTEMDLNAKDMAWDEWKAQGHWLP
mmetsp:Transcript_35730/g.93401  ORF Transcript_35730/g.93401 Transcript_35730/m.93401 type:complete len:818 (+) Transcript_35730:154-2607(+)